MASLFPGLKLQGAQCVRNVLSLTATILTELPLTSLQWVRVKPTEMQGMAKGKVSRVYAVIHFLMYGVYCPDLIHITVGIYSALGTLAMHIHEELQ